jgi:hypothetical protein
VTADGTLKGGRRGWYLATALAAFQGELARTGDGPRVHFAERLDDWEEINGFDDVDMAFAVAAETFEIDLARC